MVTRRDKLIAQALGEASENDVDDAIDKSLDAQAYQRAMGDKLPTTMTQWEWEEWYEMHGVPEEHRRAQAAEPQETSSTSRKTPWWQRLFRQKAKKHTTRPNCSRNASEDEEF